MVGWVWLQNIRAPPPAHLACVSHTETLCGVYTADILCLYSRYIMSIQQIYGLYIADEQVVECQNWTKIMKSGPNQVRMARFGIIFNQNGSYRV